MAQTTAAIPQSGFKLEVSLDNTTWTDITGSAATVEVGGGEAQIGEQMTADGEYAIVTAGQKITPYDITCRCVYTETSLQPWKLVSVQFYSAAKTIYLRWSPAGGAIGTQRFTASKDGANPGLVSIVSCNPPALDASSGDPALFEFSVRAPAILEAVIAS